MISRFVRFNNNILKRYFSHDRKLPQVTYNDSILDKKKIGIKSERKEDEMKNNEINENEQKRQNFDSDLLHLLPKKN
jgi:hypothetical protein